MRKSFSDLEYAAKKKLTRRDRFLAKINSETPWGKVHKLIEPFYPKVQGASRPPIGCMSPNNASVHLTKASKM
jgi:IS5 family transposase